MELHLQHRKIAWLGIIGFLLGLIFLTKMEVFIAISAALFAGIFFALSTEKPKIKNIFKIFSAGLAGFITPVIGFIIYFSRYMPIKKVLSSLLIEYRSLMETSVARNLFFVYIRGMENPFANVLESIATTFLYAITLLGFCVIADVISLMPHGKKFRQPATYVAGAIIVSLPFFIEERTWLELGKGLPLAVFLLGVYLFIKLLRSRKENDSEFSRLLPLFILTIFGFILLLKIILRARVYHIGFALAMPATLLVVMLFIYHAPEFLGKLLGNVSIIRTLSLVMVTVVLVMHMWIAIKIYLGMTYPISSCPDKILTYHPILSDRGPTVKSALDAIEKLIGKDDTFTVFPEGAMLNYLSRRANPCVFANFLPQEMEIYGEEKMLDSLRKNTPDYIILIPRDMSEFGYEPFGEGYGRKISGWVQANCTRIATILGKEPFGKGDFNITIMAKQCE